MRGPMVSQLVTQLVRSTNWGELDYLLIDFPPGTGDIQLSLCQELSLDGAIIVTTPQKLSYVDVVKGIEMFDDLKVPTLAIVENMSYFNCGTCNTEHKIFGSGHTEQLKSQFGIKNSFNLPLLPEVSKFSDSGVPAVLALPDGVEIVEQYSSIARSVMTELDEIVDRIKNLPDISYEPKDGLIHIKHPDPTKSKSINPYHLRVKCKCAACVDEFSGHSLIQERQIPEDVYPTNIQIKGNYAAAVVWSDGHRSSIYPFDLLYSEEIESS